jgi:glycosyltransferase involved in cell wall biosynthesis
MPRTRNSGRRNRARDIVRVVGSRADEPGRVTLVVPGGLRSPSGGNVYDRIMVRALRARGWTIAVSEAAPQQTDHIVVLDSLAMPDGPPPGADRVVALLHQLPSEADDRPSSREPERRVLRSASLVVTVSRHLAERVSRETEARVVVISPGWDRACADRRADDGSVLCVGHAGPHKGVADAIGAFERARLDGARFRLAGDHRRDPGEAERIDASVAALGRDLVLEGVLAAASLADRYASARVLVSASLYEGWPIAVAEAMASGVPVVAFDVAGVRELVRHEQEGLLVPVGDVADLARALERVWTDASLRDRMGRSARARARSWPTWRDASRRFVEALESVANVRVHRTGAA